MAGIFPAHTDGGLAPNALMPTNPAQAYAPHLYPPVGGSWPLDTPALYYGNGCNVRLRPAVINSLISEITATTDRAEVNYRSTSLQNLETSIRYLIQRGIPRGAVLIEQNPWYYAASLDPPVTRYNDLMAMTFIPQMAVGATQNRGYVRVSLDGQVYVPLLRNDGEELRGHDLLPFKPFIAVYWQGAFYYVGLANSQVPLVLVGAIDFWIRPDGNDETGDGTANSADKAFRTIEGAWWAVGSRYAGSPGSHIVLKLGIPGDYEGATIGPYGSNVTLMGDVNNKASYRILTKTYGTPGQAPTAAWCLRPGGINNFTLMGVNLCMTYPYNTANGCQCYRCARTAGIYQDCQMSLHVSNPGGCIVMCEDGSYMHNGGHNYFQGNGQTIPVGLQTHSTSKHPGYPPGGPQAINYWENINFSTCGYLITDRSAAGHSNMVTQLANTNGARYNVNSSAILYTDGNVIPGSTAGTSGSQGQVL